MRLKQVTELISNGDLFQPHLKYIWFFASKTPLRHISSCKLLCKSEHFFPDFRYIDILNSQLQSFQLKFTERLENRLSSRTIRVLLSNRKLTGRKRIVFDNNVHMIATFSDELENIKQLKFNYIFLLDQTILLQFGSSIDRPLNLPQYPGSNNYFSIPEVNI
jgi:hypothetical protein